MAQGTLQQMAREVQAYCPSVPYTLAQRFIMNRYRQIAEGALWSFKIGEGSFYTPAAYSTGTITMTNNSATVTGSGTTFTSSMVGRQLKVGNFVSTITAFGGVTSLTIGNTWQGDTSADQTYKILQAYITPEDSDFHAWLSILDPSAGRRLNLGFTSMDLDRVDPTRSGEGDPTLVASRSYDPDSNTPMYELWTHPTSLKQYRYLYEKRVTDLTSPSSTPPNIIRSDILVKGALADLSRWPGTREDPNPFYDPYFTQYKTRDMEFREEINTILIADQNIYMTDLTKWETYNYFPLDSNFLQRHAY